ncbi:hypothetical protein [Rhodoferax lithotrophicus]|uniref:hypothetical protein n=1 Tax=Rhodoferax lithotrophicus TaxID=2798804 RepID=UPI001CC61481|nr:hypothetical protein [Rhodoferax sp. MIZ03]
MKKKKLGYCMISQPGKHNHGESGQGCKCNHHTTARPHVPVRKFLLESGWYVRVWAHDETVSVSEKEGSSLHHTLQQMYLLYCGKCNFCMQQFKLKETRQ